MRLRAHDHFTSSTLTGGKSGADQAHFTLRLRDQQSMWMQDGCKVYMDFYMASNESCFMVTWTIFKYHLLKVGFAERTMRPGHSEHSQPLIYFILSCVSTRMIRNSLKSHLVEGPVTYGFTLHLRVREHTTWVWRCVGSGLWTLSFGLSQFHGYGIWLMCEVAVS
jgi:hypothetical protein